MREVYSALIDMRAEHAEQFGAMRHGYRSQPSREFIAGHRDEDFTIRPPQSALHGRDALRLKLIPQAQRAQGPQGISPERNPRADFPEFRRLLEYFDIHPDSA